jgi:hypothetical protein
LAIQTGPGVEFVGEEEEEAGRTTSTNRREFVYRVGLVYEFEIGKLLVTAQVHYDYSSRNDAVVYATALGSGSESIVSGKRVNSSPRALKKTSALRSSSPPKISTCGPRI